MKPFLRILSIILLALGAIALVGLMLAYFAGLPFLIHPTLCAFIAALAALIVGAVLWCIAHPMAGKGFDDPYDDGDWSDHYPGRFL